MVKRILWVVLACWSLGAGARETGNAVLHETFDGNRTSAFVSMLLKDQHLALADGQGVGGSGAIKATYVGYDRGSKRIAVFYPLPKKSLEYTLNYDVKFCDNFQFVKGGKLPGLVPDKSVTGGDKVTPETWSARLMFGRRGVVKTYVYHQALTGEFGQSVNAKDFFFQTGRYYAISYHVRLNDPASEANGFAVLYVDGQEVVRHDNIRYRGVDTPSSLISTIYFNTFHGGHTPDFAPKSANGSYTSVCAYFDNVAAYPRLSIRQAAGDEPAQTGRRQRRSNPS